MSRPSHSAFGALLLLAAACDDKDTEFTDLEDTGFADDDPPPTLDACNPQSAAYRVSFDPVIIADEYDVCSTVNMTGSIDASGAYVVAASARGYDYLPPEDEGVLVDLYVVEDSSGYVYPENRVPSPTDTMTPLDDSTNALWWVPFIGDELDDWNTCAPSCSYGFMGIEIFDTDVVDDDNCTIYDDDGGDGIYDEEGLHLCYTLNLWSKEPTPPPDAPCTAGSGTFHLVPYRYQDKDSDGKMAVQWRPVMESGRGAMTGAASITQVRIVDDHNVPLKVIHKDQTYSFGDDDTLIVPRGGSTSVSDRTTTRFARSQLTGGAAFVSEDYPKTEKLDMEAKLTWSCPAAASVASAPPAIEQGYTFALSDIGCDYKQKVTFRPMLTGSNPRVRLELYGQRANFLDVPVAYNDGWYFDYKTRSVNIGGHLDAGFSPADGAKVTFSKIDFLGVQQCTPGTYTIGKEK